MASGYEKQHASRENIDQVLAYLGGGATVASTKFSVATQQIRVASEIQGWLSVGYSTTVTVGTNGMKIAPNVEGEYFSCISGMLAAFNSTSTSTGLISITEMT